MVEVCHDDHEAHVFFAEEVGDGDFDVVELDKGGAGGGGVGGFDGGCCYAFDAGDEDHVEAFVGFAGGYKVVGESSVCDPV